MKDKVLIARLEGQVDESFSLAADLPSPGERMDVLCAGVNRINSTGVKKWMLYFQGISRRTQIRFLEVSPALVEQLNLISNFACGGEVVSIGMPYSCPHCRHSFATVMSCADLRKSTLIPAHQPCPKCGKDGASFDDVLEEYLKFLNL